MDGVTGFFGKIPASGDFVARGLQAGLRPILDRWLTRHLAHSARQPELWPASGLRGLWSPTGHGPLALLILPSHDAAARQFPVVFCATAHGSDQSGIDLWADAVLARIDLSQSADQIVSAVQEVLQPTSSHNPATAPLFWDDAQSGPAVEALIRL